MNRAESETGGKNGNTAIDRERLLTTLVELCELRGPSREEGLVRAYVRERLSSLGLEPAEDSRGNLYVKTPDSGNGLEPVFLCAHMDTVPVPAERKVTVIREDGRIRSDGTTILGGDDRQGVAALLEMLRLAVHTPEVARPIDGIFTVEEELGSLGSRDVDAGRVRARQGYNLDGESHPGSVIHAAPRKGRFTMTVHGRSSHAALDPDAGINAIAVAADIIGELPLGKPSPSATSNVGTITGGRQTNVVPDEVSFTGEIRSPEDEEFETLRSRFEEIAQRVAGRWGSSVSAEWEETYRAYRVDREEPCARWFIEACEGRGLSPEFLSSKGGGDANQLNNLGLRCVVLGLGMHNIHSVDEYVVEDEYVEAVELLSDIVFPRGHA
jgi:tripeptide aminopeptidase